MLTLDKLAPKHMDVMRTNKIRMRQRISIVHITAI